MQENIKSYKDLQVWQEAMQLVASIYQVAKGFPETEKFGIVQQMCRAAVSVPANIAEGHGSSHRKVFLNHLSIARGSLMEVETYLQLAEKLGFAKGNELRPIQNQLENVSRLLSGLIRSLKT
jgi:four helix bundle protein